MVLLKARAYHDIIGTNVVPLVATSASPHVLLVQSAPVSNHDTFLRAVVEFSFTAVVGAPTSDVPPEQWWAQTGVFLTGWWSPTGSSVPGATAGTSEHFLGSRLLYPTLVASPSAPTEYYVTWAPIEPLVFENSRVDLTATVRPTFILSLYVFDVDHALDGTYAAIDANYYGRVNSIWGTRP